MLQMMVKTLSLSGTGTTVPIIISIHTHKEKVASERQGTIVIPSTSTLFVQQINCINFQPMTSSSRHNSFGFDERASEGKKIKRKIHIH